MNIYQIVGTALAFYLYIPLGYQLYTGKSKQNIATWLLWGALDFEVALSLYIQHGNWFLPGAYVFGATSMCICMLKAKTFSWGRMETVTCAMVFICLAGWYISGPRMATWLSTIGVVLAGVPQLKDAYNDPESMPLSSYIGYVLANGISTAGGTAWTVEERLYPAACTVLCIGIVVTTYMRRKSLVE